MGYTGGTTPDPTYQAIGDHTEALRVEFDPTRVSYEDLIRKFWNEYDPMPFEFTGYQYRSAVWCHTPTQEAVVGAVRGQLNSRKTAPTAIGEAGPFYRAEEYHQQFIAKQTMRVGI